MKIFPISIFKNVNIHKDIYSGIPLFMRAGDGNESDKAVWRQILSDVKKQIKLDSIMVCDSALLSL